MAERVGSGDRRTVLYQRSRASTNGDSGTPGPRNAALHVEAEPAMNDIGDPTSYDLVPYDSHPYAGSHPDNLATIARLFGLNPPAVERCRVLELGCASGGNLIPMAVALAEASFVGIDLSGRQIDEGRQLLERIGLENVELRHGSIVEIGPDDGVFDYIVCHGVYSWVDRDVQDAILRICSENLAPTGVAYVSYNTFPGWFMRGMVRRMMGFHASQFSEPQDQVQQARALLDFLIEAGPAGDPTYHALLVRELEILRGRQDSYLFHEHLEENNAPLFFYEFVERAEAVDLRYLGEASFGEMVAGNVSAVAERTLRELGAGLIHSEQYLDFLRNRTFRRTLLCHAKPEPNRQLDTDRLRGFHVGANLAPATSHPNLTTPGNVTFRGPGEVSITIEHPLLKSALARLREVYPRSVPFDELPDLAAPDFVSAESGPLRIRSADSHDRDRADLGTMVFELYSKGLLELRVTPVRFRVDPGPRPVASPLARVQAESGRWVTNLRHEMITLSELECVLLPLLDGTRDHAALRDVLVERIVAGSLVVERRGQRIADEAGARPVATEIVEDALARIGRHALLLAEDAPDGAAT